MTYLTKKQLQEIPEADRELAIEITDPEYWQEEIMEMWEEEFQDSLERMAEESDRLAGLIAKGQAEEAALEAWTMLTMMGISAEEAEMEIRHSQYMMPPEKYRMEEDEEEEEGEDWTGMAEALF